MLQLSLRLPKSMVVVRCLGAWTSRAKCSRLPSMAGTPVPPCTSLCPSSGWGCSGPGWRLSARWPGCCRQLSACRGTFRCAAPAGPSTGSDRRWRLPSVSWFWPQQPDLRRWGRFLLHRRSAARRKYPAPRSRHQSCPLVTPLTVHSTRSRVLRRRWRTWATVSWWRSSRRCKALGPWSEFLSGALYFVVLTPEIISSSFISFRTRWIVPRWIVSHHSFSCCVQEIS